MSGQDPDPRMAVARASEQNRAPRTFEEIVDGQDVVTLRMELAGVIGQFEQRIGRHQRFGNEINADEDIRPFIAAMRKVLNRE